MKLQKINATVEELNELTSLLSAHKFRVADFSKKDIVNDTFKIAHVGITKDKSRNNVGSLISIWNTNKATDKAFNVRISNDLHDKLSSLSKAVEIILSTATYKDSDELCIKFYSIADVTLFFERLFAYTAAALKETKEETTKEAIAIETVAS